MRVFCALAFLLCVSAELQSQSEGSSTVEEFNRQFHEKYDYLLNQEIDVEDVDDCGQNECSNNCMSSCASISCQRNCGVVCNRSCGKRKSSKAKIIKVPVFIKQERLPEKEQKSMNLTADVTVSSQLNNTIYIPIIINNTNINNISHANPQTSNLNASGCCMQVQPRECSFHSSDNVTCKTEIEKRCKPDCHSPVVVYHPQPIYVRVPVPVPVHHPEKQIVEKPVYKYIEKPVYVDRYHQVPVIQKVKVNVPYQVHVPYPVKVPYSVKVPYPYPVYLQQQQQQNNHCRQVMYNGLQMPSCRSYDDASIYRQTDQRFLIDENYSNGAYEDCSNCLYCHGRFSARSCLNSNMCTFSCRNYLMPFKNRLGADNFRCSINQGQFYCV
ncbi:PREDICTED: uncharacterized protein LOC108567822 [Nicrophorus vespilloides]|uniref:Uncharacterized protein LOC108567822 n=1 Tax=Nicrophorus vespilloides TaxID=110193 RepID=A0ABM1NB06_NICVS|nr:PREDICTED: uncharacterized protein LOC108567822 [Nicrophorus vespilloides]